MKRALILTLILSMIIFASGCTSAPKSNQSDTAGLPNPASTYCTENGGTLSILTAGDGSQAGYCVFPSGIQCEEWAFYRGECKGD